MLSIVVLWIAGFLFFVYSLPIQPSDDINRVDAIVVWTGGGCRIATGLELLAAGVSDKLFISGISDMYRDTETTGEQNKNSNPSLSIDTVFAWSEKQHHPQHTINEVADPLAKLRLWGTKGWNPLRAFKKSCNECQIDLSLDQISELMQKTYFGSQAKTTIGNAIETARWAKLNRIQSIRLVTSPMHIPRSLVECQRYLSDIQVIIHPVELSKFNHRHWYKDWRIAYKIAIEYSKYLSVLLGVRIQRQENLYEEKEDSKSR